MGHPLAHLDLGIDDVVGADTAQDAAVVVADRFGPDVVDLELDEQRRDQDTGFDVAADGDNGAVEVGYTELAERPDVGAVGGHDLGESACQARYPFGGAVDGQYFDAATGQFERDGGAEAAEADQHDGSFLSANDGPLLGGVRRGGCAGVVRVPRPG